VVFEDTFSSRTSTTNLICLVGGGFSWAHNQGALLETTRHQKPIVTKKDGPEERETDRIIIIISPQT